jgi:hypothetical protein
MISPDELSELLATLYAALLQPEKWQVFVDQLSRLTKISWGYLIHRQRESWRGDIGRGRL